jgi:hypothetical protein
MQHHGAALWATTGAAAVSPELGIQIGGLRSTAMLQYDA